MIIQMDNVEFAFYAVLAWFVIGFVWHLILLCISSPYSGYKTFKAQMEYLCYVNSTWHSLIAVILAVWANYYSCHGW